MERNARVQIVHLDIRATVEAWYALHEMRRRVIAKVRADVTDTKTTATGNQITRMIVHTFVQDRNLYNATSYLVSYYEHSQ